MLRPFVRGFKLLLGGYPRINKNKNKYIHKRYMDHCGQYLSIVYTIALDA